MLGEVLPSTVGAQAAKAFVGGVFCIGLVGLEALKGLALAANSIHHREARVVVNEGDKIDRLGVECSSLHWPADV
jgi:hypothetical protein